jgi:hypothetical protein
MEFLDIFIWEVSLNFVCTFQFSVSLDNYNGHFKTCLNVCILDEFKLTKLVIEQKKNALNRLA